MEHNTYMAINERDFGRMMAMTEANAKAIEETNKALDKQSSHIVWLYRLGFMTLLGIIITFTNAEISKIRKDRVKTEKTIYENSKNDKQIHVLDKYL